MLLPQLIDRITFFTCTNRINGAPPHPTIFFDPSPTPTPLWKTLKMVKKVIKNIDSSKASGPDCIPVVVLKNYEPEHLYILAGLFDMCLKESCFPNFWKASLVVPVFNNVRGTYTAKYYCFVSLLFLVSKIFEKLANNRIVDHLQICGFYLISSMVLGLLNELQIFWQLYVI